MTACIYYLGLYPEVCNRLRKEIDESYTSKETDGPITYNEAQHLPFLKAVVSESLRLFPSIIFQLLRTSPGISVNGIYIPAGYDIGISAKAQNRNPAVFGQDADEFRPERWLDAPEVVATYERLNMTFGGNGPRGCIGKNIALVSWSTWIC
jgi:cytochrome P450